MTDNMNRLWQNNDSKKLIKDKEGGIHLRFDKGIDPDIRNSCKAFIYYLESKYVFSNKINLYFKRDEYVHSRNGTGNYSGIIWCPYDKNKHPNIKIATGDILKLIETRGRDNAIAALLLSIAHELSHYYQWRKDINIDNEKQACYYANIILNEYKNTREHP